MRAAVEISMYPLTGDYRPAIQAFIDRLNTHSDLTVRTNTLATQIWGPLDRVMVILTEEMTRSAAATGAPQLIFVMKVLPGLNPPDSAPPASASAPGPNASR
ncbi:MAG: hypothetical protein QOF32_861 [Gammaproteobacteria bacterium]|jgi:uncharacterized protein YqgV (UPF0045/DUF77 family)|nr:hypothetical protein [Gammaproteobacteria bacterium]